MDSAAVVTTIAEWEACTGAAVITLDSAVAIEVAGAVIANPLTNYRITRGVKIARPTNSLSLSRRQALSKKKNKQTKGCNLSPVWRERVKYAGQNKAMRCYV